MDFNTGKQSEGPESSPEPEDEARTRSGGGGEFTYTDPVQSFVETVRRLIQGPTGFFRGLGRAGDFINPAIFALICYEVYVVLGGIVGLFGSLLFSDQSGQGAGAAVGGFFLGVILGPIIGAIILFVTAGVRHLLVMLLIGSGNAGFEATFRVQAYTFTTRLIWWIPILGALIGFVWGVVLSIFGIREAHATTTGKAALVVLIPLAIGLILLAVLVAVLGAVIFTVLQQQIQ